MKTTGRMDVPQEFLERYYGPNSGAEERKDFEAWVRAKRDSLKGSPAFLSVEEAAKKAVDATKQDDLDISSVWKEPEDIGERFVVISADLREDAYIAGYKEVVDERAIVDLIKGDESSNIQEIEEV